MFGPSANQKLLVVGSVALASFVGGLVFARLEKSVLKEI